MDNFTSENLSHDPIHGYIGFVAQPFLAKQEICERQIIDGVWVQRMRQIRQLQTAWWVFPTAEHTRFQHILGVMHLASRAVAGLYESLLEIDPTTPSLYYVESLIRMAGLLHDVGHGPFGHFFDAHFLGHYGLTHEVLGAHIITHELAGDLSQVRRCPSGELLSGETLDPIQVAWLIQRPKVSTAEPDQPFWLQLLRSLFCGIYTIDNMDFVLRDSFMTGLSPRSFDLQRILHYSRYTQQGLTIHERGMPALIHFLSMKAELFRNVYFHRTVRAIDLELAELFANSRKYLFPGDPREHLDAYLDLTEFSLLTDVKRWRKSSDPGLSTLGDQWHRWLSRRIPWTMICQRNLSFVDGQNENCSVFATPSALRHYLQERLPTDLKNLPFAVDVARHMHRPHTRGATSGLNFYFDSTTRQVRPLTMHGLYQRLPVSHTIARIYAHDLSHQALFSELIDQLVGPSMEDDATNM
ncbi:MAG: HD domain-containing protein [Planctomycetales bacterium]|nr:HD domain-containing protein [Planctomycetales bacterium]